MADINNVEKNCKVSENGDSEAQYSSFIQQNATKNESDDKLNVSSYSSNILQDSLELNNSSSSSIKPLVLNKKLQANEADEFLPPKEDDEYDLYRQEHKNINSANNFSNSSLVANYGDSDLFPLGNSRPNLNAPFPEISRDSNNNPMFDPFGTRNSSNANIGNPAGGMIFDPFKNKPKDNRDKPGYSGYPGAKYDYPFGNLGGSNNNGPGGFI
ncbi:hypothetical protein QEN19_000964 [Hanseniaspora menglaensis]